jgi:hypothetical protein
MRRLQATTRRREARRRTTTRRREARRREARRREALGLSILEGLAAKPRAALVKEERPNAKHCRLALTIK